MPTPRMRTAEGILKQLRDDDPNTAVSLHYIRGVIKSGRIPVVSAGCRLLVDYDLFLEYLSKGDSPEDPPVKYGKIRRVV